MLSFPYRKNNIWVNKRGFTMERNCHREAPKKICLKNSINLKKCGLAVFIRIHKQETISMHIKIIVV